MIFTRFCKIKNHHQVELTYLYKDHNELCCICCINKIKTKDFGQHNNCNVCTIEEIINEKKKHLNKNIKTLENYYNILEKLIIHLKSSIDNASIKREVLKAEISQFFTKI